MWVNPINIHQYQTPVSPMVWDDTKNFFLDSKTVRKLYQQSQKDQMVIDLKIQQKCARCPYIDDCTKQLSGCDEPKT